MDWIALAQDRDRWCVLVTDEINMGFINCGEFIY